MSVGRWQVDKNGIVSDHSVKAFNDGVVRGHTVGTALLVVGALLGAILFIAGVVLLVAAFKVGVRVVVVGGGRGYMSPSPAAAAAPPFARHSAC